MLNALFIVEENYKFKEIEKLMLSEFFVDYIGKLDSSLSAISKLEFGYDVFFLLKDPSYEEISAVNRLIKNKVVVYQTTNPDNWIVNGRDKLLVYDLKSNLNDSRKIILKASNMVGKANYFKGVEKIAAFNPFHVDLNWEAVLNGNDSTKAMVGDLALRSGKDVIIGQRIRNFVFFSCDILSDEVMTVKMDNGRFVFNLLSDLLGGAEIVE